MLKLATLSLLSLAVSVHGYSFESAACRGEQICISLVAGFEFAEVNDEGVIVGCQFGQTSDEFTDDFCSFDPDDCNQNIEHNCQCVSEADADAGLAREALFADIVAYISIGLLVIGIGIHCFRVRRFRIKEDKWLAEYEAAGKDLKKVGLEPTPPTTCYCWIFYLIAVSLIIAFFVTSANIKNQGFWLGCGQRAEIEALGIGAPTVAPTGSPTLAPTGSPSLSPTLTPEV